MGDSCQALRIVICMLIDCFLHQFLGSIRKGLRIPIQIHLVSKLKKQVVDVRRCLLAILLTTCSIDDICTEVLPYFPVLFFSFLVASWLLASWQENPTCYLQPSSCAAVYWASVWFPLAFSFWSYVVGHLIVWRLHASRSLELRESFFQFNPLCLHRWRVFEFSWHSLCTFFLLMITRGLSNHLDLGTPA